jgi:outer membrane receptor protein involved in Fe transport
MRTVNKSARTLLAAALLLWSDAALAQTETGSDVAPSASDQQAQPRRGQSVEEFVIVGQQEVSTLDQVRFSESMLDVLSADDFKVTADSSVADALSRVSGVTIVDDKFVYVRGLGERYSSTLFNSALLPSPDPLRRVVPLDLFPTGVMEQLSIQKTWAPYLPADFSGGSVQLTTKRVPMEREASLSFSTSFNDQTSFEKVQWHRGDGSDWTGFEGGSRRLPKEIVEASAGTGRLPSDLTPEQVQMLGLALNRTFRVDEETLAPDFGLDGSWTDSYDTPIGNVGLLAGFRYKNAWRHIPDEIVRDVRESVIFADLLRTRTVNSISYAGLAAVEWTPREEHLLRSSIFYTRRTDNRFFNTTGDRRENSRNVHEIETEWEERALWTAQLTGEHALETPMAWDMDWGVTFASTSLDQPDSRFYQYDRAEGSDGPFTMPKSVSSNLRQWLWLEDSTWDTYVDLTTPLPGWRWIAPDLRVGTKYMTKSRDFERRQFRFDPRRFPRPDFDRISGRPIEEIFADDNIGRDKWALAESTQFSDSYEAEEEFIAGYAQIDTELGPDVQLMTGVRYETSTQTSTTFDVSGGGTNVNTLEDDFILPAVSIMWSFRDDMQLRGGFSQTINRPDLLEFASEQSAYRNPETRDVHIGNPGLQIATITNYDLRWEWYHRAKDNVQIALFYKTFADPIENNVLSRGGTGGSFVIQPINGEEATLYGLEVSARQGLDIVSDRLREFHVKFSGAMIQSEVSLSQDFGSLFRHKRPMIGQSDWVVNAQLTWERLLWDTQATLAFNMAEERVYAAGNQKQGGDVLEQPPPTLDLILSKGFELFDDRYSVQFQARNLFDPSFEQSVAGVTTRSYRVGRTFEFSIERQF